MKINEQRMESRIDTIELDRRKEVEEHRHVSVVPLDFVPEPINTIEIEPVRQPLINLKEPVVTIEAVQPQQAQTQPIQQPTYLQ